MPIASSAPSRAQTLPSQPTTPAFALTDVACANSHGSWMRARWNVHEMSMLGAT